ncbi:ferritin-like fold-containing protein [Phycicoccus flavus]|uniref:Hydroxylase n=1 Tax=Phycicoccus flavus TaxID=2502783 RepID=A0A8T6QYI3_9MICO|nr:ferritin-like fold-containing protein [Phycicoccus flavus]NHA66928.1 hydroxylase [Phycicoccus flavus]
MEQPSSAPPSDPGLQAAVGDLLGVLAYGELTAFIRMAVDCDLAPTIALKTATGQLATTDFARYTQLVDHMRERGIDPEAAMGPFVAPLTAFHERTAPKGWLEGLVKAYVGDGIAKDFYREMSAFVDEETRSVMQAALDDGGHAEFVVQIVRDAIRTDATTAGRLALWGRRLLGEALSQAQAVAVERDAMSALLVGGGVDLGEVGRMFTRLTDNHQRRMNRMGLEA